MDNNAVVSRKALGMQVSEEEAATSDQDRIKAADFVQAELVQKIRDKFNCCLIDWILLIFCAKRRGLTPSSTTTVSSTGGQVTEQLQAYLDALFTRPGVVERFPVKPTVLSRKAIEFVVENGNTESHVIKVAGGRPVELGTGAAGAVYLARFVDSGRQVAVKIATDSSCDLNFVIHEASIQMHLNDTNAAPFCHGLLALDPLELDEEVAEQLPSDTPRAAIVMDVVGARGAAKPADLDSFIDVLRPNPRKAEPALLRDLFKQVAQKLDRIHAKGVIVNDIKETNVMLTAVCDSDGRRIEPSFIDFGSARYGDFYFPVPDCVRCEPDDYTHLAPEMLRVEDPETNVSVQTDIFSFGRMVSDVGHAVNVMALMECGMFCTRSIPHRRMALAKVAEVLEKTKYSCVMEDLV